MKRSAYLHGVDVATARTALVEDETFDAADAATGSSPEPTGDIDEAAAEAARALDQMIRPANGRGSSALEPFPTPADSSQPIEMLVAPAPRQTPMLAKSELEGIADEAWTRFVQALKTQQPSTVTASNGLGMFELKPRRLADFGLVRNLAHARSPSNRMVWVGEFVPPLTQKQFLASPKLQYKALVASMKDYLRRLRDGSIPKPDGGRPDGMTLSGALAVLHRCGPSGLKTWNDEANRFPDTVAVYNAANGIF